MITPKRSFWNDRSEMSVSETNTLKRLTLNRILWNDSLWNEYSETNHSEMNASHTSRSFFLNLWRPTPPCHLMPSFFSMSLFVEMEQTSKFWLTVVLHCLKSHVTSRYYVKQRVGLYSGFVRKYQAYRCHNSFVIVSSPCKQQKLHTTKRCGTYGS